MVSDSDRVQAGTDKPRYRLFNRANEERRQAWEENFTSEFKRDLEHERQRGNAQSNADLAAAETDANLTAIERSAISHAKVAMAIANTNHQAAAAALLKGNAATTWAVNQIGHLNQLRTTVKEDADALAVIDHNKGMVRRVACGLMMDWESAALGMDVDPLQVGGRP
ncbi:hypothetical protein V7x_54990 [Crateriforma conspicua]|uniref:Uncharacterized protein n=1 Tax=Crateriforma conspicua TaxID=2527996 RepID=A0A5C6FHE4_9PLAN|nr:hypothetical protein V7x_54990 [Crateriforma conspicua]